MPRPAKPSSKKQAKGPGTRPAPEPPTDFMAVRMLSGPQAGQVVRVTRERAVALCSGWTPQAELVARNVVQDRETR